MEFTRPLRITAALAAAAAAVPLLVGPSAQAATTYTITDLGTGLAVGNSSYADGINDLGQVVGAAEFGDEGFYTAAVFGGGTPLNLGTFGGQTSAANAINNAGQIVGEADLPNLSGTNAFLTTIGSKAPLTNLGTLPLSNSTSPYTAYSASSANAINAAGVIVGNSNIAPAPSGLDNSHAARFSASAAAVDLGPSDNTLSSVAYAINASGLTGGATFEPNESSEHAYEQDATGGTMFELPNLGNSADLFSAVYGLNDAGAAVGVSQTSDANTSIEHAFLYANGMLTDLGTLNGAGTLSEAFAINNAGQIVGDSQFSDTAFNSDPFLYQDGTMVDLNTLNPAGSPFVTLDDAYDINNLGQIVGDGTLADGTEQAFVLSPAGVPEPASSGLIGIAGAGLLARRRVRRTSSRALAPGRC